MIDISWESFALSLHHPLHVCRCVHVSMSHCMYVHVLIHVIQMVWYGMMAFEIVPPSKLKRVR